MTLYVIFPILLNFPIMLMCVFKTVIQRKKTVDYFKVTSESFFFFKKMLFMILCMHVVFD